MAIILLMLAPTPAWAGSTPPVPVATATVGGDGAETFAESGSTGSVDGSPGQAQPVGTQRFEYRIDNACSVNGQGDPQCAASIAACAGVGPGPLSWVYRRRVPAAGAQPGNWQFLGRTCFPDTTPGQAPTPQLTYAMIQQAFHLTPWATASISTQPKGDITLVGLTTYYQVNWSTTGYEPGEIDTIDPAQMLGHHVDIRPRIDSVIYRFGDSQGFGPTPDLGGVWPTGNITHAYPRTGRYAVHVEVTWTADFRVDAGPWTPIPDTITVTGPDTTVTVKTARAVLVSH